MKRTTLVVCGMLVVSCGGSRAESGDDPSAAAAGAATEGASEAASSGIGGGFSASGAGGTASNGTGGSASDAGCKRVDLVISVDNSGSMKEEKDALANDVFPAFANALLAVGGGLEDYRVGVLDACPLPASYHTRGVAGECNFSSGERWMVSSSPDLVGEFQCVGDVWSGDSLCTGDNDDEQPASASAASLEAPASAGPNAGFHRSDALLVVVGITDEDEQPTPPRSAQEVHDRLVAAAGDVNRMVFVGIGGKANCSGVYGSAKKATELQAVTNLFIAEGRGVFWDLCTGKLEEGLTAAMQVIEQACQDFPEQPK